MRLVVFLPEALPAAHATCAWQLRDRKGALLSSGSDRLADLPSAARIEAIAPASRVLLTQVELPRHGLRTLRRALAFTVEERLVSDPAGAHVVLGPRRADGRHAIAVVDKGWMSAWLAALTEHDRAPRSMRVETCLAPLQGNAWTVVWRHEGGFVRTGQASGLALDGGSEEPAPPMALAMALAEAKAAGESPAAVLVRPAAGELPDLEAWSGQLAQRCVAGEPWDGFPADEGGGIELLQGAFAPAARTRPPGLRTAAILAGVIAAVHIFGTVLHWGALRLEQSRLQAEVRTLFQATFPQAQAMADPAWQTRRQLLSLRRSSGQGEPGDFVALLAQAAPHITAIEGARLQRLAYERPRLRVTVEMADAAAARALLERLLSGGVAAALEGVEPAGTGIAARFALTAEQTP